MIDRLEVSSRASKQDGWVRCERAGNGRAPRASWAVAPGPLALGAAVIALSTFTDSVRNLVGLATGARGPSPDEARKELSRLSVNYSQERRRESIQRSVTTEYRR